MTTNKYIPMYDNESLKFFLLNIVKQLSIIPTGEIEEFIRSNRSNLNNWHSIGSLIDPTAYRNQLYSGEFDTADGVLEMYDHLLAVRKLIDQHNQHVNEQRQRQGLPPLQGQDK